MFLSFRFLLLIFGPQLCNGCCCIVICKTIFFSLLILNECLKQHRQWIGNPECPSMLYFLNAQVCYIFFFSSIIDQNDLRFSAAVLLEPFKVVTLSDHGNANSHYSFVRSLKEWLRVGVVY